MSIVIAGGGASGTLLAAALLRQPRAVDVTLVEPCAELGKGVAYSTSLLAHRLNVRAGRMSGLPDDPGHFLRWLSREDPSAHEGTFAPRAIYGRYLRAVLAEALTRAAPGSHFAHLVGRVVEVLPLPSGVRVALSAGPPLEADALVLALGNLPPAAVPLLPKGGAAARHFVVDPWAPQALASIDPDRPVLLVGTGLTAIDVALALRDQHHRGRILAVSRRGLLAKTQASAQPPLVLPPMGTSPGPLTAFLPEDPADRRNLRRLTRAVRAEAARLVGSGGDWHALLEDLRPITPALWTGLPWQERRRFLRHLQPHWDVHRHRMAPEVADEIQGMIRAGALEVRAARLCSFAADPSGVRVTLAPRGGRRAEERVVGAVLTCTGPGTLAAARHPLLRSLVARGLVRADPLGLGLEALPDGRVMAADGSPGPGIYAIGPLLKGVLWESTAIPEIRAQAQALAGVLARIRS